MNLIETGFEGLKLIEPKIFSDDRGYFFESYNVNTFKQLGIDTEFVQDNQSLSQAGVVRGLHFQAPPFAQGKLVRVIKGAVKDIVVDIRTNSETFGKSYSVKLDEHNKKMLWIPPGFAHGFVTLENDTIFSYKCTNLYNKDSEGCIIWNDTDLDIDWNVENPVVSDKDKKGEAFKTFVSPF